MTSVYQGHMSRVLRNRTKGMSVKAAFKKGVADWNRMHGRVTKSNPGGIDLGQVLLIGGAVYLVDTLLLGGQIVNAITSAFKGKSQ